MTVRLRSHPDIYLNDHINQVKCAMKSILEHHSSVIATEEIIWILERLAENHDLGKANSSFQKYIAAPNEYHGDQLGKSHSPLSTLFSLGLSEVENWDLLTSLIISVCTIGHHSRLPTFPAMNLFDAVVSPSDIGRFTIGELGQVIMEQLESIDFLALESEVTIPVSSIYSYIQTRNPLRQAKKYLNRKILSQFYQLNEDDRITFRLKAQLAYSVLLEADKALLAVTDSERYLRRVPREWQSVWIDKAIKPGNSSTINQIRAEVRNAVVTQVRNTDSKQHIFCLTAPTGCGKTYLSASWALLWRERFEQDNGSCKLQKYPTIIIVLPFLSIIDQTVQIYNDLLEANNIIRNGEWLLSSHSLADRSYNEDMEAQEEAFFIDTWRSELIITTYDQFLMALMDPHARHQMRFHNLCDSLIIIDEAQSLPCQLWEPLDRIMRCLAEDFNSRILMMSATMPPFLKEAKSLLPAYSHFYGRCCRYKLKLRLGNYPLTIEQFAEEVLNRRSEWLKLGLRVLITMNTRSSARYVLDEMRKTWPDEYRHIPLLFITADVTPKDRLTNINIVKEGRPCIVVSTQCIEAGVDIDMDLIIRDFAPMDCIIQISGRGNREGQKPRAIVEIVDLCQNHQPDNDGTLTPGKRYSDMIYDPVHLGITRSILNARIEVSDEVLEEDILTLSEQYFSDLLEKKDTGSVHVERFAAWLDDTPVQELLRGKERQQYTFIVSEEDPDILDELRDICAIEERWKRREAWRKVAGRLALISISVNVDYRFKPESIAEQSYGQWILKKGNYSKEQGLLINGDVDFW